MLLQNNLRGFQHLGIPVVDMAVAKDWYTRHFGFETAYETTLGEGPEAVQIAFLRRQDILLEFYRLTGADLEEVKGRAHGHIDHFAIDVLDLRAAMQRLQAEGVQLDPETPDEPVSLPQFYARGVEYVFFKSPNGEKVELNQRLDLNPARRTENLNGWAHLGIPVTDLPRSMAFYSRFGFESEMQAIIPAGEESVRAAMMTLNGFTLELYQLLPADLEGIRARQDGHVDHFTLDVADVDQAFTELKEAGMVPLEDEPVQLPFWENGVRYFNVRGPDGEKIEFNQKL